MIPYHLRSFVLCSTCLLLFLSSQEQTNLPGYSVINYNSDNALPQNSINDMAFDRNGFLWLATEMGMVRFNGQHFREYNMANSPALYSNRCFLVNAVKGQILMEPGFASHRMLTLTADYRIQEDSLLSVNRYQCNRWSNCIFYYDNIYKKWGSDSTAFSGLLNKLDLNGDLVTENERQAYVRKDSSCYYLNDNTADVHRLPEMDGHALKIQFMVGDIFFYVDRQNRFYAYKQGRWQKNISCSGRLREIFSQAESGAYPSQYTVNAIRDTIHTFLVYKGNILLLNIRNGLLDFEVLVPNTAIKNINCLIYDEVYRTLYIGTATSGLYILKKHEFERLFFSSDHYAINSLYAQVEIGDGRILSSSGVLRRHSGVNIPTPGLYDRPALLRSSDGYIWYSNYDSLKKIDTSLRNQVTVQYLGGWLMAIIETGNKDILYCTLHKLFRRKGNDVDTLLDTPALMQGADIQVIREIDPNDLWIGTSSGLFSYDLVKGTLIRLPGIEKASVRAIYKASDGTIWIGTYGQGFYKYAKGRFFKMPIDHGNNLATVHCIMEDKRGNFWLPTNKGLYRVAKQALDRYASNNKENVFYYYFDKSSGFTSNEFNGGCMPCGIVMRDGHFSLPSLDGLIQFNPDSIAIEPPDHPIFIDRLTMDEKQVSISDHFKQRQDAGPLVFVIGSPYFGNPANLHLEYSIPQLDSKWRPVNNDGKLVLTGLHKGEYTLMIREPANNGQYSYETVQWTILPYWYETIWFMLLIAIVAISTLFFIFWLRYARAIKRAELLEQKVTERTQALSASNRVKEKMIAVILHDLRSPIRFLHMMAMHIYENHQRTSLPELGDMLLKFRNATHDLNGFTQDFLVWTNAQKEGFIIRQEKIILREIVEEIISLYEPAADMHNNTVLNLVPPDIRLVSDSNILKLIIRNLADNANKYTKNGEIKMEAIQDASTVRIVISDTGKAMNKELVAEILSNTYQADNDNHGFGYRIILELLAKIQGVLDIATAGETGNKITLIFRTGTA
ncbi:MAG TPA: two-component regulator propeller domain-containing protein [Niastella sp.]